MRDLTVGDLRDMLEALDDDTIIRVAIQPGHPLQLAIDADVRIIGGVAYLRATEHPYDVNPYAPRAAFGDVDDTGALTCTNCDEPTTLVVDDGDDDTRNLPDPICSSCARRLNMDTRQLDADDVEQLAAALAVAS